MKIKGKVHCFFEQSGTFKNEFIKLGIPAEDYDIQNEYGQTDHQIDLFREIRQGWDNKPGLFDDITPDDLTMAFFPCIYFEGLQQTFFTLSALGTKGWTWRHKIEYAMDRMDKRSEFHRLLYKLYGLCHERGLRLIIENPFGNPYLIHGQNFPYPTLVDLNRMTRGDHFIKPTAYWFVNCKPTEGLHTYQNDKKKRLINKTASSPITGICSKERSEISPDYARNFICDFILGKSQKGTQLNLFGNEQE